MKNKLNFKLLSLILCMILSACQKEQDKYQPIPLENKMPTVNAGADVEIILPVNTLILVGTASDEDGTIKSQLWTQKSGTNNALLTNQTNNEANASALQVGEYIFEFQATDNRGGVSKDEVRVVVKPSPITGDNPNAIRLKQITYSSSDFISLEYNTEGKLSRYVSQYQNTQGNPQSIRRLVYELKYDEMGRLAEITENGYIKTVYYYTNGVLNRTERRNLSNELLDRRNYFFVQGKLKEEIRTTRNQINEWVLIRTQFEYNAWGNLINKIIAYKNKDNSHFTVTDIITYSNFDNQKKADDFRMIFPFLFEMVFQISNPRLMEHRSTDGKLILSEVYNFQYRSNGLPQSITKQNLQIPNATLNGTFIYE